MKRLRLPLEHRLYAPPARRGERLLYASTDGLPIELDTERWRVSRSLALGLPLFSPPVLTRRRVYLASGDRVLGIPWEERKE